MIVGLMGSPLYFWARTALPGAALVHPLVGAAVIPGRLMALAVELWILQQHITMLLKIDAAARDKSGGGAERRKN
jgi:hypothetical protein